MQRARSFRFDLARRVQIHRRTKKDRLKEYTNESSLLVWLKCNLLLFFDTGWCQHGIKICYDFVESLHFSSLWVLVVDLDRSLRLYYSSCASLNITRYLYVFPHHVYCHYTSIGIVSSDILTNSNSNSITTTLKHRNSFTMTLLLGALLNALNVVPLATRKLSRS